MLKRDLTMIVIIALACALGISLWMGFKSPYLDPDAKEHLGKLTYTVPKEGNWVYGDFGGCTGNEFPGKDGTYAVGEKGKVVEKGYIDMGDLFTELSVAYGEGVGKPNKEKIKWDDRYKVPICVQDLAVFTDETDKEEGTYWQATFRVKDEYYVVRLVKTEDSATDLRAKGAEFITGLGYDDTLSDDYTEGGHPQKRGVPKIGKEEKV